MDKPFQSDLDYDALLEKSRDDFIEKWTNDKPSPHSDLANFDIIQVLGSGSFGIVKLVKNKNSKQIHAVKFLSKNHIIKTKQTKNVYNEKRIMNSMNFPFLMPLDFSFKDNTFLCLAMPFIGGGEMYMHHRKVIKFTEHETKFYAAQIFLALEYMHSLKLIYRDLKPENILLERDGYIKITDFGFTKGNEDRTFTFCGTPEYLAPEIIQSKSYGASVDWWAFGVLLFEFVTGAVPFSNDGENVLAMYSKICEGDYKMPVYLSLRLKHLIENLLQVDLSRRLGNLINGDKDIKNHDWFDSIDWFDILNRQIKPPYIPPLKSLEDTSQFHGELNPFLEELSLINTYENEFAEF